MQRLLACLFLLLASCGEGTVPASVPGAVLPVSHLTVGNHRITAEIASTRKSRSNGLMHRSAMPADHGMLFLYPDEQVLTFWMKDTPLPLSIAFADGSGRIVHIADMEPHSRELVPSGEPVRFALEMHQGWFSRHGVLPGDAIRGIPRVAVE